MNVKTQPPLHPTFSPAYSLYLIIIFMGAFSAVSLEQFHGSRILRYYIEQVTRNYEAWIYFSGFVRWLEFCILCRKSMIEAIASTPVILTE